MCDVSSECINYTQINNSGYTLGDFAEELIRILPHTPEAFTYLLCLALNGKFGSNEEDVHSMISYIAESIGQSKLEQVLSAPRNLMLSFSQTPVIDESVMSLLDDAGMQLAIMLSRHMYGDLSETDTLSAAYSRQALHAGSGEYKTAFTVSGRQVILSTDMTSRIPTIALA